MSEKQREAPDMYPEKEPKDVPEIKPTEIPGELHKERDEDKGTEKIRDLNTPEIYY